LCGPRSAERRNGEDLKAISAILPAKPGETCNSIQRLVSPYPLIILVFRAAHSPNSTIPFRETGLYPLKEQKISFFIKHFAVVHHQRKQQGMFQSRKSIAASNGDWDE
jgi:hypothetical protein